MIHRVYSNLGGFKELAFREGLNLVLADKSPGATDRQTRNGAGKSSLVELIHFLTGGSCNPDSIFRVPELKEASFGLDFDLCGRRGLTRSAQVDLQSFLTVLGRKATPLLLLSCVA